MQKIGSFIFLLIALASPVSAETEDWVVLAKRLTNDSEQQQQAVIKELKQIKNLSTKLLPALDTADRHLALEVMVALQMTELVPMLLRKVKEDRQGFLTLAINALLTQAIVDPVSRVYARLLHPKNADELSPGTIMAILDTLGRFGVLLSKPTINYHLYAESVEVQMATVYYLRMLLRKPKGSLYLESIKRALKASSYQVRLQAVTALSEVKDRYSVQKIAQSCILDVHPKVKIQCLALAGFKDVN